MHLISIKKAGVDKRRIFILFLAWQRRVGNGTGEKSDKKPRENKSQKVPAGLWDSMGRDGPGEQSLLQQSSVEQECRWSRKGWLTCEQEGDEAGFLGQEELQAGATEHVLHHGLGAAGALQEGQELLRLLRVLQQNGNSGTPGIPKAAPRPPEPAGRRDLGMELSDPSSGWVVHPKHSPNPSPNPKYIPGSIPNTS